MAKDKTKTPISLSNLEEFKNQLATVAISGSYKNLLNIPATFTPSAHNQASSTINAMTGYSKPTSTSAIAASDTLNAAIGKIEKALDGKQPIGSYVTSSGTAAKATADANGNVIADTYVKSVSISGRTVTITKGNGSSETQTTQDTTYTPGAGLSLSGTQFINTGVRSVVAGATPNILTINTGGTTSSITINKVDYAARAGLHTIKSSNEINLDYSETSWSGATELYFNYRGTSTDKKVTNYKMWDGAGSSGALANVTANTFVGKLSGNATTATTATNVTVTETNPSSATTYYLPFLGGRSGGQGVKSNNGAQYYSLEGTADAVGKAELGLGNSIASGTAGNKKGKIYLYGSNTGYTYIDTANSSTSNYTVTIPAKSGTIALTSDNVSSATKATQDGNGAVISSTYLKLAGGTMTGVINMPENKATMNFRSTNASYYATVNYDTNGNEALAINLKNAVTSFMVNTGTDGTTWTAAGKWNTVTPALQVKNNSVYINELIPNGTTLAYKLNVNGNTNIKGNCSITGQVTKPNTSTSWVTGRNVAPFRTLAAASPEDSQYVPILSAKSYQGSWELGPYTSNILHLSYITDANYDAGTNAQTADFQFKTDGTIVAKTFSGNATSATKATQDGNGSTITSTYLKLSGGGTVNKQITIQGATNSANAIGTDNPRIEFSNSDRSQYCRLMYTDYDAVQAPDSLTLVGNQSGTYFIAPNIKATGSFYGSLSGNASTATTAMTSHSLLMHSVTSVSNLSSVADGWYNFTGTILDTNGTWIVTKRTIGGKGSLYSATNLEDPRIVLNSNDLSTWVSPYAYWHA